MGNMSYCRFYNTLSDLKECYENIGCTTTEEEKIAEKQLIDLCKKIAKEN